MNPSLPYRRSSTPNRSQLDGNQLQPTSRVYSPFFHQTPTSPYGSSASSSPYFPTAAPNELRGGSFPSSSPFMFPPHSNQLPSTVPKTLTRQGQHPYTSVVTPGMMACVESSKKGQLPILLFSSLSVNRLRPLLHHGDTSKLAATTSTMHGHSSSLFDSSRCNTLFHLSTLSLSDLFQLKQSSTIQADLLLIAGKKSVAFIVITPKEIDIHQKRVAFVKRCHQLQKQHRNLFVVFINLLIGTSDVNPSICAASFGKVASQVDDRIKCSIDLRAELKNELSLPPILTCSSLQFAVESIGLVTRVITQQQPILRQQTNSHGPNREEQSCVTSLMNQTERQQTIQPSGITVKVEEKDN